jgi:Ca-activated chloride channel family protein
MQPVSVAFVLDNSGSVGPEFGNVTLAARDFLGYLVRDDRASISTLMWDCQPLTDDVRTLTTVLRMDLPLDWGSPVWSATSRAMTALSAERTRRAVLLFSDGEDTGVGAPNLTLGSPPAHRPFSPCRFAWKERSGGLREVRDHAERDSVMVYAVSVAGPGGTGSGDDDLQRLAQDTGGERYRLGAYTDLRAAFRRIAEELHLQYQLGFSPQTFDGKRHEIEVKVKRPGVTVRARKSYVAVKSG